MSGTGKDYKQTWGKNDPRNTTQEERYERAAKAQIYSNAYNDFTTDMYVAGWSDHFHFCRFQPNETITEGLIRHEIFLAMMCEMKPGMKILEIGCGLGTPARTLAALTGASVTAVNLNKYQLSEARRYTEKAGLTKWVEFIEADFMVCYYSSPTFV